MEKIIIIKYGELTTKKENINFFLSTLKKNILFALKDYEVKINYDRGRMFIEPKDNFNEICQKLSYVFGIHEIVIGNKYKTNDINELSKLIIEELKDKTFKTFKVNTKRSDKSLSKTSIEINKELGGIILKNIPNINVSVKNPDILINIEIRREASYIYYEKIDGIGGYPVGSLGKGILMLSGGIDSPVAGYLAIKRGIKIEALYFESPPHTSENAKNKVIDLARKLALYNNDIKLHIINFTVIQEAIYKNIPIDYLITIMRRMMYRISVKIAYQNNAKIIINGESIGQVASQTLTSMSVINETIKMPVIRPVACFDKNEIIAVAKKIGTFDTSILPYEDCCTVFVPKHPVINPTLDKCLEYEKLIDFESLVNEAVKNHQTIKITEEDNKFSDIL